MAGHDSLHGCLGWRMAHEHVAAAIPRCEVPFCQISLGLECDALEHTNDDSVFCWGAVIACSAAANNFVSLMVVRFLLG